MLVTPVMLVTRLCVTVTKVFRSANHGVRGEEGP